MPGVPGAGGHDALFAVVEGGGVREVAAAEAMWVAWPGGGLTRLLLSDSPAAGEPGAGLPGGGQLLWRSAHSMGEEGTATAYN